VPRRSYQRITYLIFMWGRLVTCGRLAIGLPIIRPGLRRIANPPQDAILPHMIRTNFGFFQRRDDFWWDRRSSFVVCHLSGGRPRKTMVRPTRNHLQTSCGEAALCYNITSPRRIASETASVLLAAPSFAKIEAT
jgi:hypothetical protein